jgi:tripartite-type tricarboxylate transporter receptor subunit TctC
VPGGSVPLSTMKLLLSLCLMAAATFNTVAVAQTSQGYPNKPIRLVVPFPAGGATDLFARSISQRLGDKLGASVIIDNKPGAGGVIGSEQVAKAPADGYTLLIATTSTHSVGPAINPRIPYSVDGDFTPIAQVGSAPNIMLVPTTAPAKTLKEWVDYARKNPGKLNYASSGNGTIVHLTAELFKSYADVFLVHIPYKGTALSIPDLASGKVDVLFDSLPTGLPHVRDGRLRALAVTSAKRTALAPELPAVAELLPGFESTTWFGIYGPKGLPADIQAKVNAAVAQTLADSEVSGKLARLGIEPVTGTPQQFAQMVAADTAKWKKIITQRKITAE